MKEILESLKKGEIVIVTDDKDRENEADMICAMENVSAENINIMAKYAKGLICFPMSKEYAKRLELDYMVKENTDNHQTAFTVSIDYKDTKTGISAYERALTARKLCDENSKPEDFRKPGHCFPLIAKDNGVLERKGHTEATVDLMKLAKLKPLGICCEIMDEDGHMLNGKKVKEFARKMNMKITSVSEIEDYILKSKKKFEKTEMIHLPTDFGNFKAICYRDLKTKLEHLVLFKGEVDRENLLVRMHSQCLTGDTFLSKKCDCGHQLRKAFELINEENNGMIIYLSQEGRGIGLFNKIKAYKLQEEGLDTVDANLKLGFKDDLRDYEIAAEILKDLGVKSMRLLTNNPDKIKKIEKHNIKVKKRVPIEIKSNAVDRNYLKTKTIRMNHILHEFMEA